MIRWDIRFPDCSPKWMWIGAAGFESAPRTGTAETLSAVSVRFEIISAITTPENSCGSRCISQRCLAGGRNRLLKWPSQVTSRSPGEIGCAACRAYGKPDPLLPSVMTNGAHSSERPTSMPRRGRRWLRLRRQGSTDAGQAVDPTPPRLVAGVAPLGFERARPVSLGRAVQAEALPGVARSAARRPDSKASGTAVGMVAAVG